MKKSIVISMALFAFAFGAEASVVTVERARNVARSWLAREGKAISPHSVVIQRSDVVRIPEFGEQAQYYAIKFQGAGTVVMSADDTAAPVVLFTDNDERVDFSDENSPAYALLRNDIRIRAAADAEAAQAALEPQVSSRYLFHLKRQRMLERNRKEWELLAQDGADGISTKGTFAWYGKDDWFIKIYTASSLYDTRVAPLVKSHWNQSTVTVNGKEQACYNFYTPNPRNPLDQYGYAGREDNLVCGCVATALAQVLRYFAYTGTVAKVNTLTNQPYTCTYEKQEITRYLQGGTYDWEKMTLIPSTSSSANPFTVTNAMEIGKLCADCGTAVKMDYGLAGSGAYSWDAHKALTQVFGYTSARWYDAGMEIGTRPRGSEDVVEPESFPETRAAALQRVFYSNFDAGLPILLGLTGHEVVADGYGYSKDGLDYVHINMGWGGQCDLWYLLPNVSCDSSGRPEGNLMFFEDCSYNIFTTHSDSYAVMSGRVIDDDFNPIAGAKVKICRLGEYDAPVAEFVTGENGIWGLIIEPGAYEVVASDDVATESETFTVYSGDNGNRWGCDVMLAPESVQNLTAHTLHTSLDKAILAANDGDTLEVYGLTRLRKSVTIDRNLTIQIAPGFGADPTNCLIRCNDSSVLTVTSGVRVAFSGLAFKSDAKTVIDVLSGGVAAFSGKLGVGTIHTADADGFELAGAIDYIDGYDIFVSCDAAKNVGEKFGYCSSAAAMDSAKKVLNPSDLDLGGVVRADGSIVWGDVPVDPRYAVAYVDDGSDNPVHYRTLDKLFVNNPSGDLDIKLTKDVDGLSKTIDVTGRNISISSEGGCFTVSDFASKTGFLIGAGGALTFENVIFDGFAGKWFVRIPENGGTFTLGENAQLKHLKVVGDPEPWKDGFPNGVIVVLGGEMKMGVNSLISECVYQNNLGGVISLYGGELSIDGGSIIGCSVDQSGAICYWPDAGGLLKLEGNVDICGNSVGDPGKPTPGDVFLATDDALITVAGDLVSDSGIGICGVHNVLSNTFGTVSGTLADPGVFFNDDNGRLEKPLAAIELDGELLWDYAEDTFGQCDQDEATVTVTCDAGERYYADIATAINHLAGDATIVLGDKQYLDTDAVVSGKVTIDGNGFSIVREGPGEIKVVSGGELTLKNVKINGYDTAHPWKYYVVDDYYLYAVFRGSDQMIIEVDGGKITLADGAEICWLGHEQVLDLLLSESDPYFVAAVAGYSGLYWLGWDMEGEADRASCAVTVWNGGELTMESGASIHDCWNYYYLDPVNCGATAGILIEESTAYLRGGAISNCVATIGSAMDVCQGVHGDGIVHLDGDVRMLGNVNCEGNNSDFVLEDLSKLRLDSEFTGSIGYTPGHFADPDKICEVITNLDETAVTESASHFFNNKTGSRAVAVKNDAGEYLLVWATSIGADNNYYEVCSNGVTNVWALVNGELPKALARYRAAADVVFNGQIHYALAENVGCVPVSGDSAVDAGTHTCTLIPSEGYTWDDDSTDERSFTWRITPAPLTIYPEKGQGRYFVLPEDQIAAHEPVPFRFTAGMFYGNDSIANTLTGEISHEHFGENVWAMSQYTQNTLTCTNGNYYIASFNPDEIYFYIDHSKTNDYSDVNGVDYGRPNASAPIPVTLRQLQASIGGTMFFAVDAPVGAVFDVMWTESLTEEFKLLRTVRITEDSSFEVAPDETQAEHPSGFFKIVPVKQ